MKNRFDFNPVISSLSLLTLDDKKKLKIDDDSFEHLIHYVDLIHSIPGTFFDGSSPWAKDLAEIRQLTNELGSSNTLLSELSNHPDILENPSNSSALYIQLASVIQQLQQASTSLVSSLKTLQSMDEETVNSEEVSTLLSQGARAEMNKLNKLMLSFKDLKIKLLAANESLDHTLKSEADILSQLNQDIGGLEFTEKKLQKELDDLGFFSSKSKEKKLKEELENTQTELKEKLSKSDELREMLRQIEAISKEGSWLSVAIDHIVSFLNSLETIWAALDARRSKLTVFSLNGAEQEPRLSWINSAISIKELIEQWELVVAASEKFMAKLLKN